ncbi:MAG: hypothetical protein AAF757_26770 [Cyanobacteria bacterium P01_D01_bin.116]
MLDAKLLQIFLHLSHINISAATSSTMRSQWGNDAEIASIAWLLAILPKAKIAITW